MHYIYNILVRSFGAFFFCWSKTHVRRDIGNYYRSSVISLKCVRVNKLQLVNDIKFTGKVENGSAPKPVKANYDQASLLPHLGSLDRMLKLPAMDATWQQTENVYGRVEDCNPLLAWALATAEDVVHCAVTICRSWTVHCN